MKKITAFTAVLLFILFGQNTHAQDSSTIRSGLLTAKLTLSPSHMYCDNQTYIYLHGAFEAYLSKKISVTGEVYYNVGEGNGNNTFDYNHSLFFGSSYHFTHLDNDLYVGIQPGISLTKINAKANNIANADFGVDPLVSAVVGYNYFAGSIFHFFLTSRYILGDHHYNVHKSLSEIRLSAGLGFNINTGKRRTK